MKTARTTKYRIIATVVAVSTALVLLLGGTFAWQSIQQTALNQASDTINPGGRLHDDFNGENKDVYVENFADEPIYARIRLSEYFEIGREAGFNMNDENRTGFDVITEGAVYGDTDTYNIHYFHKDNLTSPYWRWITGGSTVYLPTFNMNKDSLEADINGTLAGPDGKITAAITDDRYLDYVTYILGQLVEGIEIHDNDINSLDEGRYAIVDKNIIEIENTHTVQNTDNGTLISIDEWLQKWENDEETKGYWVYDDDGWVYWSESILPDTATGLLLDGIEFEQIFDDSWFYAIHVTAQFITADDLGINDSTGFYDHEQGSEPSEKALTLLTAIGVKVD